MAYGVLYAIEGKDKPALDRAEGKVNSYTEQFGQFPLNGITYTPTFYVTRRSHIDQTRLT